MFTTWTPQIVLSIIGPISTRAAMTRAELVKQLEEAEVQVSEGNSRIRDQQQLIDELASAGHDTTHAREVLLRFVASQAMHISVRNHVRADLKAFD